MGGTILNFGLEGSVFFMGNIDPCAAVYRFCPFARHDEQ